MGLSATQMRFLMVTARKSNVEYQGQQINQARTALANQSSALYTELLSLKAPTAPSVYTYAINPTTTPTIDWSEENPWPLAGDNLKNFMVHYAANEPSFQDFNIPEYVAAEETDNSGNTVTGWKKFLGRDDDGTKLYGPLLSDAELQNEPGVFCYKTTGKYSTGDETTYTAVHTPENGNVIYNPETGMFNLKNDTDAAGNPITLDKWFQAYNMAMSQYNAYSKPSRTAVYSTDVSNDALDALGDNVSNGDVKPVGYQLSLGKTSNDYNTAQYNAAMEEYKKDLAAYEEAYAVINQKTEQIHETDKKLELQLKQLDTEQEAIQTEYESLKKVLDKNIENTFKTFG